MVAGSPAIAQVALDDLRFMQRALLHARVGLGRTTPNPLVGACVVSPEGVVVGQGAHERAGEPHAEVHALNEAGELARGATLYCTLEPCSHTGRTGPCAVRIIEAGIARVVAAMEDPFPLVSGRGFAMLRQAGIVVDVGVGRAAALRLNQPFLRAVCDGRPFVIMKAAVSRDGYIAAARGERTPITSALARRHAQYVRAQVDAIGVGSETLLVDDPLLTARDVFRERPLVRVVFDRRLRTPPTARLFTTLAAGPVVVLAQAGAAASEKVATLQAAGAQVVVLEETGLLPALKALVPFQVQSLLLEGGPVMQAAAWDADVVDYVQLYVSPSSFGTGVPMAPSRATIGELLEQQISVLGPDQLVEGYVHRPH